jgi:hypothetical protein
MTLISANEGKVILFQLYGASGDDDSLVYWLSVPSPSMPTVGNRAIVQYEGLDDGSGKWMCSRDNGSACVHIHAACLQLLGHERVVDNPEASDAIEESSGS